jgi:hypothetical protein
MKILFRMAMLGIIVAMVTFVAKVDPKAVVTNQRDKAVKRYLRESLPDKNAELLGFSEERKLWDHTYLVGWARWKNLNGVTVVTHHVFEVDGPANMVSAWSAREFTAVKKFELLSMPTAIQAQRAKELQKFCEEMGIPIEKDI